MSCFWTDLVSVEEECAAPRNLLLAPALWADNAMASPPAIWGGTAYSYLSTEDDPTFHMILSAASPGDVVQGSLYVDPLSYNDNFDPYSMEVRDSGFNLLASYELIPGSTIAIDHPASTGMSIRNSQYFSYPVIWTLTP